MPELTGERADETEPCMPRRTASQFDPSVNGPLPPPFDPMVAAGMATRGARRSDTDLVSAIRERVEVWAVPESSLDCAGAFQVSERLVPGFEPGDPAVSLLICRPRGTSGLIPAIYLIHGGGMIAGNNRNGLGEFLEYARELGCALVSVEYRLAPENPHPAPIHDCFAGLRWLLDHADDIDVDATRIVVAGNSAGGGLAASVALLARDTQSIRLLGVFLGCPMLDDRNNTDSAVSMGDTDSWGHTANLAGWKALLGDQQGSAGVSPHAAPARATDLRALPPTFVDVGSADTLRDEAVSFASRIWSCGGVAELHVWPGGCHGFTAIAPEAAISKGATATRLAWLRRIVG
jgi:acetyl esterase/lipase